MREKIAKIERLAREILEEVEDLKNLVPFSSLDKKPIEETPDIISLLKDLAKHE